MKFRARSLALALPALLFAADASAVRQPEYLAERPVETAAGARGRAVRTSSWEAPAAQARLWQDFTDAHGRWRAIWDADTGAPTRIYGEGIPAPGANADDAKALAAARALLAQQLAMLAPGASADDFQLVSNVVHGTAGDLRTVGFVQTYRGLPVLGGQVSFLFKRDRVIVIGSEAAPRVDAAVPFAPIPTADALARATAWIESAYGASPTFLADGGLAILPLVREPTDGAPRVEHHAVRILTLDLAEPRARWDVYVDAFTGAPIARRQTLMFGAGTVKFNTPLRNPRSMRQDDPAPLLNVTINGMMATTAADGGVTWTGAAPATVMNGVTGTKIRVTSSGGNMVGSNMMMVADGAAGIWNAAAQPCIDAQLTTFVHANKIKAVAKAELNPNLGWLDQQLRATVNEVGRCNAYFDGNAIHFFNNAENICTGPSGLCENSGRIPDVIYHEFGHGLHQESIISGAGGFDPSMSEGVSDYLAATTTGDAAMGRGFFLNSNSSLRNLDPIQGEAKWPDDISAEDPHETGLIIGGALWDMRKELVTLLGAEAGKTKADDLFYATLQRATDIPSTYVEILAADDDDGNLDNGTPNKCLVDRAFAPHGLVDPLIGFGIAPPTRTGNDVTQTIGDPPGGCPRPQLGGVVLEWRLRGDSALQSIPMTQTGDDFKAAIPTQPDGSVVQYKVTVTLAGGGAVSLPDNAADPLYEFYVGPLVRVFCTDFEADPFTQGWTHGKTSGTDDWEWGVPEGSRTNGDPATATSGNHVIGNDLGVGARDGFYLPSSANFVLSPEIDVTYATGVRLQYRRWLGVEDGFYDDAEVFADDVRVWSNADSGQEDGLLTHADKEWRYQDIDLGPQAADGKVQVRFKLTSDEGAQYGGWNVDDFCIMAKTNILPGCGDGTLGGAEECDDGNNVAGDGCTESCTIEPGTEVPDDGGCCSTGSGPAGPIGLGLFSAGLLLRRRRRTAAA